MKNEEFDMPAGGGQSLLGALLVRNFRNKGDPEVSPLAIVAVRLQRYQIRHDSERHV